MTRMVLQRLHGISDREAVDAFAFNLRWKYAAGANPAGWRDVGKVGAKAELRFSGALGVTHPAALC